ncbi:MAG: hemolysin family protein [Clostridiales bacterium]|nr:hemolysin family protein [Clostridiales bacterium]
MEPGSLGALVFAAVLLAFGFLFSMSETALTSISKLSIRQMKEDGKKKAALVEKLTSNKDRLLSSILIGNNLVTIIISAIVTAFAINIANYENEALVVTIATAIVSFVIIIFGDIAPKALATRDPGRVSLFVARPISWLMIILSPISSVLNKIFSRLFSFFGKNQEEEREQREQELITFLDMSVEEGVLPEEEGEMLSAVVEFRTGVAKDIMTPRVDIVAVDIHEDSEYVLEVFETEKFSRLPVYEENIDNIVGVLNFRDFMLDLVAGKEFNVNELMRKPFFSHEYQTTAKLFAQMKAEGVSLAIILDEYGGTSGLITIEDLVETIMGEIFDEYDEEDKEIKDNEITCISPGEEYLILGSVKIEDFNELLEIELHSEDYDTMAGYVLGLFGYIPTQGETIEYGDITFSVETVERNRINSLRVEIKVEQTKDDIYL